MEKFLGNFRGKVLDNTDSSKKGRIKVEIYPFFQGIKAEYLPWCVPAFPLSTGSGSGVGSFIVPAIGSFVWVFFEAGDVDQPVYFAEAPDFVHGLPSDRTTNYPDRKVWKFSSGITIIVDDSDTSLRVIHPEGTSLVIASDGKITLTGQEDITITSGGTITMTADSLDFNP